MEYRLKDCLEKVIDNRGKNPQYFDKEKYPVIDNVFIKNNYYINDSNVNRYINQETYDNFLRGYVEKDMPIMTLVGSGIGNVGLIKNEKVAIVQNTIGFKTKSILDSKYLYYWFLTKQQELQNFNRGSGQPSIKKTDVENMIIDFPVIEEQHKIVNVLEKIDDKIELNNKINDNLYKICNTIYHDYLDKYSKLIENKKIVDIANRVVTGKTPSTKNEEFWNGDIPFITIPDMHNQVFTINTERKISNVGAKALIPKNSISVSCIATVGLVSINTEMSQTNQQINSIVLNNDYDLYYLFEFMSEQENFMKNIAGGSTTYNINKNTFENIEVPYLPKDKLIEFYNIVSKMFERIKLNQKENNDLELLRDTLLPQLMNGEIELDKI